MRRHDKPLPKLPDLPDRPASPPAPCELGPYTIEVITPIVGGGARSRQPDPVSVVRPQSVRGHLRFWWRVTQGAKYPTIAEMRTAEAAIFGSTSQASKVSIRVTPPAGNPPRKQLFMQHECFRPPVKVNVDQARLALTAPLAVPAYAAFPFREDVDAGKTIAVAKFSFQLRLSVPSENRDSVLAALKLWVNFGGIGARTRRGFGALKSSGGELSFQDEASVKSAFEAAEIVLAQSDNPVSAWFQGIETWKRFRQTTAKRQGVGRVQYRADRSQPYTWVDVLGSEKGKPSISNWPEAQIARDLVVAQNPGNATQVGWHTPDARGGIAAAIASARTSTDESMQGLFPRAALGMPIRMEMFGHKLQGANGWVQPSIVPALCTTEPGKAVLQKGDRMASPVIIRPICVGGAFYTLYLGLKGRTPPGVWLVPSMKNEKPTGWDLKSAKFFDWQAVVSPGAVYTESPMNRRSTQGDAVEAFLRYAQEQSAAGSSS